MFFLRTADTVNIQGVNEAINFNSHNRKGNQAIKVELKKNKLNFSIGELCTKMIPKGDRVIFESHPINILVTDSVRLVFQDVNHTCHFLVLDDDGMIKPTLFTDLTEDDSILLYDPPDDYILSEIQELYMAETETSDQLSPYVTYSENGGYIINEIIIT